MNARVKISVAAKTLGICYRHAIRLSDAGDIPIIRSSKGHRYVSTEWLAKQVGSAKVSGTRCAIYSRESSSENKTALKTQTAGLRAFAAAKGWEIVHVVEEFGSGVNDQRKKLNRLFQKRDFDVLLVENKDRLTRFGFNLLPPIAPFEIVVVNTAEDQTSDLMEDLVAILTSFSARLYGRRRGRAKTNAALSALEKECS